MIDDAHILSETSSSQSNNKIFDFLIDKSDGATKNRRGKVLTELIAGNNVSNTNEFRRKYNQNSKAIDSWLAEVNVQKLVDDNNDFVKKEIKNTFSRFVKDNARPFIIRVTTGSVIAILIR